MPAILGPNTQELDPESAGCICSLKPNESRQKHSVNKTLSLLGEAYESFSFLNLTLQPLIFQSAKHNKRKTTAFGKVFKKVVWVKESGVWSGDQVICDLMAFPEPEEIMKAPHFPAAVHRELAAFTTALSSSASSLNIAASGWLNSGIYIRPL